MNKKIFIYILCYILVITFTMACDNQKVENSLISLCNKIEQDIKSYRSNEMTNNELYSKIENYNNECSDEMNNICIYLKTITMIPSEREDLKESSIQNILNSCNIEF